ncbi:MAG: phytanoyl-CoA dioxygenase family protein [Armatimonadetes bacterium]|nr:phytanoyl-CoA dioxygenase family protein [Armatimonadota bacterium]
MNSETTSLLERFHTDGYLLVKEALKPEEVVRVREAVLKVFRETPSDYRSDIRLRMFEHGLVFEELIDHPALIEILEAILGSDCHLIAQNAIHTRFGESVAPFFHADDVVRFPIDEGVELDQQIVMPCFTVNMNIFLTDVTEADGPTEIVPGSHRSGRQPQDSDLASNGKPEFKGRAAVSVAASAGDALMWNDQVWHRGAPITRPHGERIVQQGAYGRRWVAQRFHPYVNYRLPDQVVERANPRRRRLLGLHEMGAYG